VTRPRGWYASRWRGQLLDGAALAAQELGRPDVPLGGGKPRGVPYPR
jgi:hypothetical protein